MHSALIAKLGSIPITGTFIVYVYYIPSMASSMAPSMAPFKSATVR